MNFDPRKLPASVFQAYKQGPMAWPLVVEKAVKEGITDLNKLADIVFFLHHPERNGRLLGPAETNLIHQWTGFRNLIFPRVQTMRGRVSGWPEQPQEFRSGKWS
jgi:hypothetical protein